MLSNAFKKRLFHLKPVQALVSQSGKLLARGKGSAGLNTDSTALRQFRDWLQRLEKGTVLELGTKRVGNQPSTLRRSWVRDTVGYIACDFEAGLDVDVVVDAESLSKTFPQSSIDAVIACSVFEHIRKPWLAAREIGKVLRPGGLVFVQTHHTYPLHAYPFDYWRFSREALEALFSAENGFANQSTWYDFPASVVAEAVPQLAGQQAFLNVNVVASKT